MSGFLHGKWNAFNIKNGKLSFRNKYKIYITHNSPTTIGIQEEGDNWKNEATVNIIGGLGSSFDVFWEDRCDSKGEGLNTSHTYQIKIVSNDLMLQISTSNGEDSFSFGNWFRYRNKKKLEQELRVAAKNGDTDVLNWLKNGGFDTSNL